MKASWTFAGPTAARRLSMSFWTPLSPFHLSGPTHFGRPFGEKYCVPRLASHASYPGNSGSVLMYRPSSQPSIPPMRSVTYLTKFGLPSSPSLTTSMPERACLSTHSATAVRTRSAKTLGSGGFPASRARSISLRSGGRGRLPVWVVRMRSVLRFNRSDLPRGARLAIRHDTSRERPLRWTFCARYGSRFACRIAPIPTTRKRDASIGLRDAPPGPTLRRVPALGRRAALSVCPDPVVQRHARLPPELPRGERSADGSRDRCGRGRDARSRSATRDHEPTLACRGGQRARGPRDRDADRPARGRDVPDGRGRLHPRSPSGAPRELGDRPIAPAIARVRGADLRVRPCGCRDRRDRRLRRDRDGR